MHVRRLRTGTLARSGAGRRIRAIGVAAAVLATALVAGAPPARPAGAVPPRPADGRYHVVTVASSGSGQLAVDDLAAGPDGRMWYSAPAFATWAIGALTPAGERAVYPMPGPVVDLVAGSDGNMWAATTDAIFRMGTGAGAPRFRCRRTADPGRHDDHPRVGPRRGRQRLVSPRGDDDRPRGPQRHDHRVRPTRRRAVRDRRRIRRGRLGGGSERQHAAPRHHGRRSDLDGVAGLGATSPGDRRRRHAVGRRSGSRQASARGRR